MGPRRVRPSSLLTPVCGTGKRSLNTRLPPLLRTVTATPAMRTKCGGGVRRIVGERAWGGRGGVEAAVAVEEPRTWPTSKSRGISSQPPETASAKTVPYGPCRTPCRARHLWRQGGRGWGKVPTMVLRIELRPMAVAEARTRMPIRSKRLRTVTRAPRAVNVSMPTCTRLSTQLTLAANKRLSASWPATKSGFPGRGACVYSAVSRDGIHLGGPTSSLADRGWAADGQPRHTP